MTMEALAGVIWAEEEYPGPLEDPICDRCDHVRSEHQVELVEGRRFGPDGSMPLYGAWGRCDVQTFRPGIPFAVQCRCVGFRLPDDLQ